MSARVAACPLVVALALHALCPRPAAAAPAGDGAAVLEVEDNVGESDSPFRPPVVFVLKRGGMVWPGEDNNDALVGIHRWQIQIFDFDDHKVQFLQGVGMPLSRRIPWDGADRRGRLVRDGFYTARLVWIDAANVARKSETVKVGLLTPPELGDFAGPSVRLVYTRDGLIIRLTEDLTFEPGQWRLRRQCYDALEKIGSYLQRYPRNRLSVLGHADSAGDMAKNRELSRKRASSIRRFLVEHGVDGSRLTYEGRGADEPIESNATAQGRRHNRRVDIVLLKATI